MDTPVAVDVLRPGPDEKDPENWDDVPGSRKSVLLLSGKSNDRMKDYHKQIAAKPTENRSTAEQIYLWYYAVKHSPSVPSLRCDPRPKEEISYVPFMITTIVLGVLVLVLLVFISRKNHWTLPMIKTTNELSPLNGTTSSTSNHSK